MERTQKNILGFLGLGVVAGMTIFAATLPVPNASATSSSSVTESIVVTVKPPEHVASVVFLDHKENDASYADPNQTIRFNYSGVDQIVATLEYTDINGATIQQTIYDQAVDLNGGTDALTLDLSGYGYGEFKIKIEGTGPNGADSDYIAFSFVPVTAKVEEDENTGEVNAILEYDDSNVDIDHFEIEIYDEDGNLVDTISPIDKPTKKVGLPFDNLPSGKYTILVSAVDATGGVIYKAWETTYKHNPLRIPDTGGLFAGLNISKVDYLVTGLIIFSLTGIGGIWIINRGRRNSRQ